MISQSSIFLLYNFNVSKLNGGTSFSNPIFSFLKLISLLDYNLPANIPLTYNLSVLSDITKNI